MRSRWGCVKEGMKLYVKDKYILEEMFEYSEQCQHSDKGCCMIVHDWALRGQFTEQRNDFINFWRMSDSEFEYSMKKRSSFREKKEQLRPKSEKSKYQIYQKTGLELRIR